MTAVGGGGAADRMRREFDATFASPPALLARQSERFLAVRIGGDAYAIRVLELSGFASARRIAVLPHSVSSLLGLAGFRGTVLPVYSLAMLLGYAAAGAARWFAMCGGSDGVALAINAFEGHLDVEPAMLRPAASHEPAGRHVVQLLHAAGTTRAVVEIPSVVRSIEDLVAGSGTSKER